MHDPSTTIVAVATPPGRGGVGCVRLSGSRAAEIAGSIFRGAVAAAPRPGGRPRFGQFVGRDGAVVDHGYLVLFGEGRSYTGEASAEIWGHGSPPVLAEIVESAVAAGATQAGPGEFTYRAVCNGRLDLSRAEAIQDLVAARTLVQARVAAAQAEGSVARSVEPLRAELEEWIARGEAAVEFVDEAETHLPAGQLAAAIACARERCDALLLGFRAGRVLRDGARLVIVGRPNAGKSSLFNRLLVEERAIVAEVPGTTRDTLEETLDLGGIPVRLVDTAGLRQADDHIEREGVRRATAARADADLVLLVIDGALPLDDEERAALDRAQVAGEAERTVIVVNKSDLPDAVGQLPYADVLRVSASSGAGLDALRTALRARLVATDTIEDPVITNVRHAQALERTRAALDRAAVATADGLSEEWVLEDLRAAMNHLGEITGEFTNEDLYDRIFADFCIGK